MGKPYVTAYLRYFPASEPTEDFDGRNLLYALLVLSTWRRSLDAETELMNHRKFNICYQLYILGTSTTGMCKCF